VLGQCVELRLERSYPFEFNVLLVSHLNQETFHPRQTLGDWLHDGGYDGLNFSPTRVRFGHWDSTLLADGCVVQSQARRGFAFAGVG
jgi:hypothetical protein